MLRDFRLEQLVEPLLGWFVENARTLPWRTDPSPYRVWVSEIMLQQTRVEAVKPYFERFMTALPEIRDLAVCQEDRLLKLWEGLGYYNRVRNMQKAAVEVVENYGGELPADYEKLFALKGIGSYTAGAVASIAYGIPVPAVDGNVLRVLTRVAADDTDIMKPSFRKETERQLASLMCKDGVLFPKNEAISGWKKKVYRANLPGAFNQALMELGAIVCVPNGVPLCEKCPWAELCVAKREGLTERLPVKNKAKSRKIEKRTILVICDGEKVAIRKRPVKGLLAGLYEFPGAEGNLKPEEALSLVKEMKLRPIHIRKLQDSKHIFSHVEWQMTGYAIRVEEAGFEEEAEENPQLIFVDAEHIKERYAIPSAFAAYTQHITMKDDGRQSGNGHRE